MSTSHAHGFTDDKGAISWLPTHLYPLMRCTDGIIYIEAKYPSFTGEDIHVYIPDKGGAYHVIRVRRTAKFRIPESIVWENLWLVVARKLVIKDRAHVGNNISKLPAINACTNVIKCINSGLTRVKYLSYVRYLNVVCNPIRYIKFSHNLRKIKVSRYCVDMGTTSHAPSLVFTCLRHINIEDNVQKLMNANIRHKTLTCSFCEQVELCETYYLHGIIKCNSCFTCLQRCVRPRFAVRIEHDHVTFARLVGTVHIRVYVVENSSGTIKVVPDKASSYNMSTSSRLTNEKALAYKRMLKRAHKILKSLNATRKIRSHSFVYSEYFMRVPTLNVYLQYDD